MPLTNNLTSPLAKPPSLIGSLDEQTQRPDPLIVMSREKPVVSIGNGIAKRIDSGRDHRNAERARFDKLDLAFRATEDVPELERRECDIHLAQERKPLPPFREGETPHSFAKTIERLG